MTYLNFCEHNVDKIENKYKHICIAVINHRQRGGTHGRSNVWSYHQVPVVKYLYPLENIVCIRSHGTFRLFDSDLLNLQSTDLIWPGKKIWSNSIFNHNFTSYITNELHMLVMPLYESTILCLNILSDPVSSMIDVFLSEFVFYICYRNLGCTKSKWEWKKIDRKSLEEQRTQISYKTIWWTGY